MMRKLGTAIAGTVLIIVSVATLSGSVALVRTHGNSMYPRITTGDLVIVAGRSNYRPGEVVAYHSRELRQVVLHLHVGDIDLAAVQGDCFRSSAVAEVEALVDELGDVEDVAAEDLGGLLVHHPLRTPKATPLGELRDLKAAQSGRSRSPDAPGSQLPLADQLGHFET